MSDEDEKCRLNVRTASTARTVECEEGEKGDVGQVWSFISPVF
jgi:hypothetical protein